MISSSSYNASKRINLPPPSLQIHSASPSNLVQPPVIAPPLNARNPPLLQRSLSSPPSSRTESSRTGEQASDKIPTTAVSYTSWAIFKNAMDHFPNRKSNCLSPLVGSTTPPNQLPSNETMTAIAPASTSTLANLLNTSLAPGVFNFSFNNKSPVPSTPPVAQNPRQFQPAELRSALLDVTVNGLHVTGLTGGEPITAARGMANQAESVIFERNETMGANTPGSGSVTPSLAQGLLPGMTMINGVPVKTSVSHPMKCVNILAFSAPTGFTDLPQCAAYPTSFHQKFCPQLQLVYSPLQLWSRLLPSMSPCLSSFNDPPDLICMT